MAPIISATIASSSKGTVRTETSNRGNMRKPQRGFHKFRKNGQLNVKPIGKERAIAIANSLQSPLLKLPPELRDRIWEFVLGGGLITPYLCYGENQNQLALLAVCRQIYQETIALPGKLNTIYIYGGINCVMPRLKRLPQIYRNTLTSIRFTFSKHLPKYTDPIVNRGLPLAAAKFPARRLVEIVILATWGKTGRDTAMAVVGRFLELNKNGTGQLRGCCLLFPDSEAHIRDYRRDDSLDSELYEVIDLD